jgi:hypothetical protein
MQGVDNLWLRAWTLKRMLCVWIVALVSAGGFIGLSLTASGKRYEEPLFWLLMILGAVIVTLPARWAYHHLLVRLEDRATRRNQKGPDARSAI